MPEYQSNTSVCLAPMTASDAISNRLNAALNRGGIVKIYRDAIVPRQLSLSGMFHAC